MRHSHDKKTACSARAIQNTLIDLGIYHLNYHFHNIAWRKKLTAIPTEISTYDFLIGFAFDVNLSVEQAISLQFADNICKTSWTELNLIVGIKNLSVTSLNSLKDLTYSLLDGQLTVRIGSLIRSRIKLKRIRNIAFILNFAENHLEQFKERRLLLKAVIHINVIMASLENE